MSKRPGARHATVKCLGEVLDKQRALSDVTALDSLKDPRERAFALRLSYGVLRWKTALEWFSSQLLDRPLKASERELQRLLWVGLYQLWQEDTADHAAVHATAETARSLGKPWAVGLVNAVLRRFQREREALVTKLGQVPARFAHPDWLLKALREDWPEDWPAIVDANNRQAPLWLRANRRAGSLEEAEDLLTAAGFSVLRHPLAPEALAISPAAPVKDIPGFAQGRFSVQDAAAQLAADLLAMKPGHRVLDACAAPGGKTGHLLEREPEIALTALDLSGERLQKVRDNLERLSLTATLVTADAAEPERWWDGTRFDRILLDAPCSATGVIRRHPEIKWLRSPDQVSQACLTQQRLLQKLWPLLEPGGILVYATCSVLKCENESQINAFLDTHNDAKCIGPDNFGQLGHSSPGFGTQLLPGAPPIHTSSDTNSDTDSGQDDADQKNRADQDTDGFFYAVLQKASP